jgi:hypothetical protein
MRKARLLGLGILLATTLSAGEALAEQTGEQWLTLRPGKALTVCVAESLTNQPVPEVAFSINGRSHRADRRRDGQDCVTLPDDFAAETMLEVSAPGFRSEHVRIERREDVLDTTTGEPVGIGLFALETGVIRGRVVDADTGQPIGGATAELKESIFLSATSDERGEFSITGIPPGEYALTVKHPSYRTGESEPVALRGEEETYRNIALVSHLITSAISGVVRDGASGRPVKGVRVTVLGVGTVHTDEFGRYAIEPVPGGFAEIVLEAPGYPRSVRGGPVIVGRFAGTRPSESFDLKLWKHSGHLTGLPIRVPAELGGKVSTSDKRLTIAVPPGGLSEDVDFTLAHVASPLAQAGDSLPIDPELTEQGIVIVALGPEFDVQISAPRGANELARINQPVQLVAFYEAREAAEFRVNENAILPWYHDGERWKPFAVVPHAIVSDSMNKLVSFSVYWPDAQPAADVAQLAAPPASADSSAPPRSRHFRMRLGAPLANAK